MNNSQKQLEMLTNLFCHAHVCSHLIYKQHIQTWQLVISLQNNEEEEEKRERRNGEKRVLEKAGAKKLRKKTRRMRRNGGISVLKPSTIQDALIQEKQQIMCSGTTCLIFSVVDVTSRHELALDAVFCYRIRYSMCSAAML